MRPQILDDGHRLGTKLLFAMIRLVSQQPVMYVVKVAKYRADFYGKQMGEITHEAMRGNSEWSVAERR
jgi:hypothetical protein